MRTKRQTSVALSYPPLPAAARHGLLRHGDLLATGLTRQAISARVRRGALTRRYRGVYSIAPGQLSRDAELLAVVLAGGEGAAARPSRGRRAVAGVALPRAAVDHRPVAPHRSAASRCTAARVSTRATVDGAPRHPGDHVRPDARRSHGHADRRGADERHPRGGVPAAVLDSADASSGDGARERAASVWRGSRRRSRSGWPGAPGSRAGWSARSSTSSSRPGCRSRSRTSTSPARRSTGSGPTRGWSSRSTGPTTLRPPSIVADDSRDLLLAEMGSTVLRFTEFEVERRPREVAAASTRA